MGSSVGSWGSGEKGARSAGEAQGPWQRLALQHLPPPYVQLWIIPSILGSSNLYFLSDDDWETISAWIYGLGLCGLFVVSTVFHTISWKKSHLRYLLPMEGDACLAGGSGLSDEAGRRVGRRILGQQPTLVEHFLPCRVLTHSSQRPCDTG